MQSTNASEPAAILIRSSATHWRTMLAITPDPPGSHRHPKQHPGQPCSPWLCIRGHQESFASSRITATRLSVRREPSAPAGGLGVFQIDYLHFNTTSTLAAASSIS